MVRLFGQVEVVTADGVAASFDKSKSLELVAWLSQHRRPPDQRARRAPRCGTWMCATRRSPTWSATPGGRWPAPSPRRRASEWLARTLTEELPLHDAVVTDADVLAAAQSTRPGAAPATGDRGAASRRSSCVTGMPFAGTSYLWPDAEGISSDAHAARRRRGDAAGRAVPRRSATPRACSGPPARACTVLAGHEELIALRMRAHAAHGDLAGVRHEWAAYERALDADPWSAAQPSPKLVAVRHELLSAPVRCSRRLSQGRSSTRPNAWRLSM